MSHNLLKKLNVVQKLYTHLLGGGMRDVISIGGPVEQVDGQLILRMPRGAGGRDFIECSRGIAHVEGDLLGSPEVPFA